MDLTELTSVFVPGKAQPAEYTVDYDKGGQAHWGMTIRPQSFAITPPVDPRPARITPPTDPRNR